MIWKSLKLQVRWWFVRVAKFKEVGAHWWFSGHHAPSNVDLHPVPEFVVLQDGSSVAEDEEEHSLAVRVSMCQGGPGARCVGVAVPASVDDGISDTESMDSDPDRADVLEGSVASGVEQVEVPVGEMVAPVRPSVASQRAGFVFLDHWDLGETFAQRGCLMRSVPRFLWGSFRVAMKVALEEIIAGVSRRSEIQQVRGWKLLLLLPRMLLHRPPRGGQIGKSKLIERFDKFAARQWQDLLVARSVPRRLGSCQDANADETTKLGESGGQVKFVQLGELSAGRQALEGAELVPRTTATLRAVRNRTTTPLDAIPELPRDLTVFNLDEVLFGKNVRSGRKGAAGGPSGMTHDHLRPLLESPKDLHLLYTVCDLFAKGQMPGEVVQAIKLGRMTALQKDGGGVRGIVAGEVIRRVTAKTIAQQLAPVVKAATVPFQYALSTRSGCECIAHAFQAVTELDPDGISAFDSITRRAMLLGLDRVAGRRQALPFVRLFHSEPSACLWEDDVGTVHTIHQGEGEGGTGGTL